MNFVLGGRSIGQVLGRSQGAAAQWWQAAGVTPTAAYAPKGAASLPDSYINLANPGTYNAAPGVAPTWDAATGWTFNGSTQYLATGVIVQGAWTTIIKFTGGPGNTNYLDCLAGAFTNASNRLEFWTYASNQLVIANAGTIATTPIQSGVLAAAGATAYRDGTAISGTMGGAWTGGTRDLYIGARNNSGTAAQQWPGIISSVWIGNTTLSAAQAAAQSAAMP